MNSIGEELDKQGGLGPGFDRLRLVLAGLVVLVHSVRVTQGPRNSYGAAWLAAEMIVPMFFVLSGFLVTASAHRHPPGRFFANRFLRIYPALAVCVLGSALILGPMVTTLSLHEYFSARSFYRYFLLLAGKAYFDLPGVFESSPDAGMVNVSLWTVRWEIGCYAAVGLAVAAGALRRKRVAATLLVAIILLPSVVFLGAHAALQFPGTEWSDAARKLIAPHEQFFVDTIPRPVLTLREFSHWFLVVVAGWNFKVVPFFAAGALAYVLRYRIPSSSPLFLLMVLGLLLGGVLLKEEWNGPLIYLGACLPTVYFVLRVGLSHWPRLPLLDRGDYSYGVYLFGFPIQQLIALAGWDQRQWWLNSLISLPLALLVAAVSWHLVEYPILRGRSLARRQSALARQQPATS